MYIVENYPYNFAMDGEKGWGGGEGVGEGRRCGRGEKEEWGAEEEKEEVANNDELKCDNTSTFF